MSLVISIPFPGLPVAALVDRASDAGEVLKIVGTAPIAVVGEYVGNGVMTLVEDDAVNLKGSSGTVSQQIRVTTASSGLYTWTYPVAYASGVVPVIECMAEGPDPQSGAVISVQIEGVPTNTSCKIRVSRSTTTIQVLGINVLSLATAVATVIHLTARAP